MAVDLETRKAPKQELYIESNLEDLRQRLRRHEVGGALLALALVVFGYAFLMGTLDYLVAGSESLWLVAVRGVAYVTFLALAATFTLIAIRRWLRPLNPYFLALEIERQIPDAKNSVINWLDLKDEKLPAAIRAAVSTRAAKDVKQSDPDKAVDGRRNWTLASVLGVVLIGLMILLALSPRQFGSLMGRAFAPFRGGALESRTAITVLRPTGGDATVPSGSRIEFAAQIEGRHPPINQPGAPMLHWRYHQKDAYLTAPLQEEAERTWTANLVPDQVKAGFWYKITAGDATTPEHRVNVKSQPLVREFEVRYLFRPYLRRDEERIKFPNDNGGWPRIAAFRGTDVVLTVHANGPMRDARIELDTGDKKKSLAVEVNSEDPSRMVAKFKVDKSGTFRVLFQSEDGQPNLDRQPYAIEAIEDLSPSVTLTKPAEDRKLPANGTLPLEGHARDDWGIQSLSLQVRVAEGGPQQELLAKAYREGKSFKFANGSYPELLDYSDFLALDALRNAKGEKFEAKPGMVLEYWLEARDNSDWPNAAGNVGKSHAYKVLVEEINKDPKKQEEERQQAQKQAQDQQQKQDQNLKQEEKRRKDEDQKGTGNPDDQKRKEELEKKLQDQAEKLKKELDGNPDPKKNDAKDQKDPDTQPNGNGNAPDPKDGKKDPADPKEQKGTAGKENSKDPMGNGGKEDPMPKTDPAKEKEPSGKENSKEKKSAGNDPMGNGGKESPKDGPMAKTDPGKEKEPSGSKEKSDPMKTGDPKKQPDTGSKDSPATEKKTDPKASNDPKQKGKDDGPKEAGSKENPKDGTSAKTEPGKEGPKEDPSKKKEGPNQAKTGPKEGPDTSTGKKEVGKEKGPNEKGTAKENPKEDPNGPKGTAKAGSEETKKDTTEGKGAPKDSPMVKDTKEPGKGAGAEDPKQTKEKSNDGPGQAKETPKLTPEQLEKYKQELTELRDKLKGPEGDKLAQEIAKKAKDTSDPEVRKALESLMKDAGREKELAKELGKKDAKDGPGSGEGTTTQELPMPKKESDPDVTAKGNPKDGSKDKKDGNASGQEFRPNQKGVDEEPKGTEANADFAKRGGNLQIETIRDLMKKLTPEKRNELGMSEKDWQEFQRNAAEYEKLMSRAARPQGKDLQSGTAKIGPGGIRTVQGSKQPADPLESGQALPPPEFRDPQRIFTTRPKKE